MTEETTRGRNQKTERRRRNTDGLAGKRRRTQLNESALDRENYAYYLARDDQIHALTTEDDWDVVDDRDGKIKKNSAGTGAEVSIHAGVSATGAPERLVLLRKPKKYQDEDEAQRLKRAEEIEAQMHQSAQTGVSPDDGMKYKVETGR